jgi:predicted dithiol-disulfide oxidoreductase (DUF899 family)
MEQSTIVPRTYSTYRRGVGLFLNTFNLLDITPLGRGEQRPMPWVRHHDRYDAGNTKGDL